MQDIASKLEHFNSIIPENITLVAVSKTKPLALLQEAYDAGQRDFGENKIQEMSEKYNVLPKDIRWHMIGHVQGNKIKQMAEFVHLVHGMDKPKRLAELNKEAKKFNRVIDCLIQIHIAEEDTKFGFSYEEASELLRDDLSSRFPNIQVRGLMGMATFSEDDAKVSEEFRKLASFFEQQKKENHSSYFNILSMGMSGDYHLAMEEGSTMLRVGSSIFGSR